MTKSQKVNIASEVNNAVPKILAIDNSKVNLLLLSNIIKMYYHDCIFMTAENGKEGIELAKQEKPELILLDVLLPEINGYEICKILKKEKATSTIPVIIISSLGQDSDERIKGLNAGADAFISKPFGKEELKAQIDVTLRIKHAEDLLRERNEKLRNLNKDIILAEEKERRRIAENLHDSLGQTLSLAYMNLSAINRGKCEPNVDKLIKDTSTLLDKAITESRLLTYDLSPPILYELGLTAAIKWKLEQVETTNNIKSTFLGENQRLYISKEYSIFLFRIVNELIVNIIKHAEAKNITVEINSDLETCTIIVSDDGIGFKDPSSKNPSKKGGFGLISITERIEELNGVFNIGSGPDNGTIAKLTIPNQIKL